MMKPSRRLGWYSIFFSRVLVWAASWSVVPGAALASDFFKWAQTPSAGFKSGSYAGRRVSEQLEFPGGGQSVGIHLAADSHAASMRREEIAGTQPVRAGGHCQRASVHGECGQADPADHERVI